MKNDERFPAAQASIRFEKSWTFRYFRFANAAEVSAGFVRLVIPLPWLPQDAYQKGWDSCFAILYDGKNKPAPRKVRYLECAKCGMQYEADPDKDYNAGVFCPECQSHGYMLVGICHLVEYEECP